MSARTPRSLAVVEQVAQPGERAAHGGLAEADAQSRCGDAAFGHQRLEGNQQVQVDPLQIYRGDIRYRPGLLERSGVLINNGLR